MQQVNDNTKENRSKLFDLWKHDSDWLRFLIEVGQRLGNAAMEDTSELLQRYCNVTLAADVHQVLSRSYLIERIISLRSIISLRPFNEMMIEHSWKMPFPFFDVILISFEIELENYSQRRSAQVARD